MTLGTPSTVGDVRISYRVDHAVRVMTRLAEVAEGEATRPVSGAQLAELDGLPPSSVDDILRLLRNGGLVRSQRGGQGGWLLARPADTITVAQVIRAVDVPSRSSVASVRTICRPTASASRSSRCGSPCAPRCARCSKR